MPERTQTGPREVRYSSWLPTFDPQPGKVVRKADMPGFALSRLSGNPADEGTDWGLIGPWINGVAEFSVGVFTMAPNQSHPPHYHPDNAEFYYVISGTCLIRVDDETIEVGPETALYFPAGSVHAVWTRADETATILYAFDERRDARVTSVWLEKTDA